MRTSQQILDQTVTALELIFMSQVAVLRTSGSTSPARQFRLAGRGSTLGEAEGGGGLSVDLVSLDGKKVQAGGNL